MVKKMIIFIIFIALFLTAIFWSKKAHGETVISKDLALAIIVPLKNVGLCKDFTVGTPWEKGFAGNLPAESKVFHIEIQPDKDEYSGYMIFRVIGSKIVLWEMRMPKGFYRSQDRPYKEPPEDLGKIAKSFAVEIFHPYTRLNFEEDFEMISDFLYNDFDEKVMTQMYAFKISNQQISAVVDIWFDAFWRESQVSYEVTKFEILQLNFAGY